MVNRAFSDLRVVAAFFRLFCVLAVAVVTTFHVCGLSTAQAAQPSAISAVVEQHADDQADFAVEECQFCMAASLPSTALTVVDVDRRDCVLAPMRALSPFTPFLTSPPPKA
ncbi:hypothetical protein LJ725_13985 [Reyranella aquatilis]|uniref:DUF2946 domain-containing protein n=1 Tax=Reyranella aquatilis TaxID=2035356 RepID=A0ABS8KVI9_9HYPH|nr:hypothetical protein [Reyranella aquatilis]MCC8430082.1 hypothetical protein [Reyranella aquatilis]